MFRPSCRSIFCPCSKAVFVSFCLCLLFSLFFSYCGFGETATVPSRRVQGIQRTSGKVCVCSGNLARSVSCKRSIKARLCYLRVIGEDGGRWPLWAELGARVRVRGRRFRDKEVWSPGPLRQFQATTATRPALKHTLGYSKGVDADVSVPSAAVLQFYRYTFRPSTPKRAFLGRWVPLQASRWNTGSVAGRTPQASTLASMRSARSRFRSKRRTVQADRAPTGGRWVEE